MRKDRVQLYPVRTIQHARFSFLGKQWRFSLLTSSPKNAELIAYEIERGLDKGKFDSVLSWDRRRSHYQDFNSPAWASP
jgi:hypothetical protein